MDFAVSAVSENEHDNKSDDKCDRKINSSFSKHTPFWLVQVYALHVKECLNSKNLFEKMLMDVGGLPIFPSQFLLGCLSFFGETAAYDGDS